MDECKCKWKSLTCFDDPGTGIAFNIRFCEICGSLKKEMVWDNPGDSFCKAEEHLVTVK